MDTSRRSFLMTAGGAGLGIAVARTLGLADVAAAGQPAGRGLGYGELVSDPAGLLDLPTGFQYRAFSRAAVDALDDGSPVPAFHDGMAAFSGPGNTTLLVRNHEIAPDDVEEDGVVPVPHVAGATYDPNGTGGTTTLAVGPNRRLVASRISLAGTSTNCAGGPTPWGTWLTCEETDEVIDGMRHGYVFEVDPRQGGNPAPILAMGRFEHEAVSFDPEGVAYLTEDADGPNGLVYRFQPDQPLGGRGSLHAGGALAALLVPDLGGDDLSAVSAIGTTFTGIEWVPVPVVDPGEDDTPVRESVDATRVPKAEGTWRGSDGAIWFVSSRGDGPDAEDPDEASSGVHGGQIWRVDPSAGSLQLVAWFAQDSFAEAPDNITTSPYGYLIACTDGEDDDQYLVGVTSEGERFPFAYNRMSNQEFAGATFSPDGRTLFVNVQEPGTTFAIWGPWRR